MNAVQAFLHRCLYRNGINTGWTVHRAGLESSLPQHIVLQRIFDLVLTEAHVMARDLPPAVVAQVTGGVLHLQQVAPGFSRWGSSDSEEQPSTLHRWVKHSLRNHLGAATIYPEQTACSQRHGCERRACQALVLESIGC